MKAQLTLEEVKTRIDELPEFAREPVLRAYSALRELEFHRLSMPKCGYANQCDAFISDIICEGIGKPRTILITVTGHTEPIEWCTYEVIPSCGCIMDQIKKIQRTRDMQYRSYDEFRKKMPKEIKGYNGSKFHIHMVRPIDCNKTMYEYKEVVS